MDLSELRTAVQKDGYVVVPNVLSPREIGALRSMVSKFCAADQGTYFVNESKANLNVFAPEPEEIASLLLRQKALASVVKAIVGDDLFFMRELGVAIGGSSGWHKDTHGLARSVRGEHDGYAVYKVLVYPQDHLGLDEDDFALKVRKGSHWIPSVDEGAVETLFVRAGDIIVIDCRTSHRGRNSTTEDANLMARALYFPFNRGAPRVTFAARRTLWRLAGKKERHLVTLVFGRPNSFSEEYMRQGRQVLKMRYPHVDVDRALPMTWKQALDDVNIAY